MLNVSPIGRNCSYEERLEFNKYDEEHGIRKALVTELQSKFAHLNLCYVIGGQISIDIFPKGWDKTYCLQHVRSKNFREIHFFGDKTLPVLPSSCRCASLPKLTSTAGTERLRDLRLRRDDWPRSGEPGPHHAHLEGALWRPVDTWHTLINERDTVQILFRLSIGIRNESATADLGADHTLLHQG